MALRHNTVCSISELLNTPELLVSTSICGNSGYFLVGCSSECTLSTLDSNLEVRITQVTACAVDWSDGPALMRTIHIVADTGRDVTLWPCVDDLCKCLVGDWLNRLLHLVAVEPALALLLHTNEINGELKCITTAL